jgi:hypothetical protein
VTEQERDEAFLWIKRELAGLREEFGHLETDLAVVKTDVQWLKGFFWIVVGSSVASLLAATATLLSRRI